MIFFDITKTAATAHNSGLTRVTRRLLAELQASAREHADVTPVIWKKRAWRDAATARPVTPTPADWLFTAELFSEPEREGITTFIDTARATRACRLAAIFHDAIPLKFPEITWPKSVQRAPAYMKLLANFDRILAVSRQSAAELADFWKWQGLAPRATITQIANGADFSPAPRTQTPAPAPAPRALICLGILEPRKNQTFLLDICASLWDEGLQFDLHLAGRVNPEFGHPTKEKIKRLRKKYRTLRHHESPTDTQLQTLYTQTRAAVFPTIAEGCGLPPLEAMWHGLPCVCSALPVLREYTDAGGCVNVPVNNFPAWQTALRDILLDDAHHARLRAEAMTRPLPTWSESAATLRRALA